MDTLFGGIWNGIIGIRNRIISHGDAIQGITSCLALYFTWKLFQFTRKKPQIILEYTSGKWLLKNVGDLILSNMKLSILDIKMKKEYFEYDADINSLEMIVKTDIEEALINLDHKISICDIGLNQIIEINRIFLGQKFEEGYSLLNDRGEIIMISNKYQEEIWKMQESEQSFEPQDETPNLLEEEMKELYQSFFDSIVSLSLRIEGDGYAQDIKYVR